MMKSLAMYGGVVVGMLLRLVERRLRIEPGVLLLVYLAGFLVGCIIGG